MKSDLIRTILLGLGISPLVRTTEQGNVTPSGGGETDLVKNHAGRGAQRSAPMRDSGFMDFCGNSTRVEWREGADQLVERRFVGP